MVVEQVLSILRFEQRCKLAELPPTGSEFGVVVFNSSLSRLTINDYTFVKGADVYDGLSE